MQQDYTYAVARIRFRETKLLSDADIASLNAAPDEGAAMRLLRDKGWGDNTADLDAEELLASEREKLWDFIGEVIPEKEAFSFLNVPSDYHNLKVAVKCVIRDIKPEGLFLYNAPTDPDALYEALKMRDYEALPEHLRELGKDATSVLLQTSDGQLCDIVIDKACMEHIRRLGMEAENEIVQKYCELFVASADIKIAVRSAKTGKSIDFIRRAMAECDTLDAQKLAQAASLSCSDIIAYLSTTEYSSAIEAISTSMSAFEKWCDDHLTALLRSQKWEPFGFGPVVAYILARENEIKAVRLILSAKHNGIPEEIVKERLRKMYA